MVKPEWGTKRACPKCGTRFYDLQQDEPVTCIACSTQWMPEPVLKSKQPLPFDVPKPDLPKVEADDDADLGDEDLDIADEEEGEEEDVDLGGDDDLGVAKPADDEN